MNNRTLQHAWPTLQKQVKHLDVPWLDSMANNQRSPDPFHVLISCILSLRTQDRTTGSASTRLFRLARDPAAMSRLPAAQIERAIYPVGFYRVKAVRIREISRVLATHYHAQVPDTIDELLKLKGVGRKTANLVITLGFGKPGICVDTHVHRIMNRWGYISTGSPDETESELRKKLPEKYWIPINGLLVSFGQGICKPLSPLCSRCGIARYCEKKGVGKHR